MEKYTLTGTFELKFESPVTIHRKMRKCICDMEDATHHEGSYMEAVGFYKNRFGLFESLGTFSKVEADLEVECECGRLMKKWSREHKYHSDDENACGWYDILVTCNCKSPKPNYMIEKIKLE